MSSCATTNLGSTDREIDAFWNAGHMPRPSAFAVVSEAGSGFNSGDLVTFLVSPRLHRWFWPRKRSEPFAKNANKMRRFQR